jgi:hypothetical protein
MLKLMETQIPTSFSKALYNDKGYDLHRDQTNVVADILFTGVAECLGDIKTRETPVAFVFQENNLDFIAGALIQYMPNEDDPTLPGSWSYTWTWNKDDIPEDAVIRTTNDVGLSSYFRGVSQSKYGMAFENSAAVTEVLRTFMLTVRQWLDENASETEEVGVEAEGVFQASVVVENGEKIFALIPEGEIKKLIKDDAAIEK